MSSGSSVRRLFWNGSERRLRTPWRLALGLFLTVVVGVGGLLAGSGLSALAGGTAPAAVVALVDTIGLVAPYAGFSGGILLAAWVIDRRELSDLGLCHSAAWWTDLAFGLALGVALPGLVFAVELATGYLRVTGTFVYRPDASLAMGRGVPPGLALALTLVYFVGVGVFEELLFRGYALTNIAEGLDGWLGISRRGAILGAVALTSVLFGLAHGTNPNATLVALVTIPLFGGLFAASYLVTGRIAVAIGVHVTWNFAISSLFGFPVSGFTTPVTVLAVEQSGPLLVTGGGFGPEGGVVSLVALVVGSAAIFAWVRWREGEVALREHVVVPDLLAGHSETGSGQHAEPQRKREE